VLVLNALPAAERDDMRIFKLIALLALCVMMISAADIAGKWEAKFETPDGQTRTSTFNFKVDGSTLTGTVASARGESPISEGKVSGDSLTFVVVRELNGNQFKMNYKGTVNGSDMKLTVSFGEDRTFEMTAKKI
jgi:hypothetical protein